MGNWGLLHRYKWSETHPFNRTVSFRPILRLTFFVVLSCLVAPFWGIVKQIDCGSHQHVQDFYVSLHVFFLLPMDIDMIYNDTHTHIYIYTQWGLIVHILQLLRHIQSGIKTCIAGFVWIPVVITFSANHFVMWHSLRCIPSFSIQGQS